MKCDLHSLPLFRQRNLPKSVMRLHTPVKMFTSLNLDHFQNEISFFFFIILHSIRATYTKDCIHNLGGDESMFKEVVYKRGTLFNEITSCYNCRPSYIVLTAMIT